MADASSGTQPKRLALLWRVAGAVGALALVFCAGWWVTGRRPAAPAAPRAAPVARGKSPVVLRDLKSGVAISPGSPADAPELIVDPFPEDPLPAGVEGGKPGTRNSRFLFVSGLPMDGPVVGMEIRPQAGFGKPTDNLFRVDGRGSIANEAMLGKYLYGSLKPELRNPPTFLVKANGPCRLNIRFSRVNKQAGAEVEFVIDDLVIPMLNLPGAKEADARVGRTLDLEIPQGEHRVTIRNVGRDWVAVDWYRFSGHLSD